MLEEAAIALQRGGKVKVLLPASFHDGVTQIVGIKEDQDLDAGRGLAPPDELSGQFRGLAERELQGRSLRFLHIKPDPKGNDMITDHQDCADILMSPNIGLGRGVFHLGHRVHSLAPFGLLGVINDQVNGLPLAQSVGAEQFPSLLAEGGLGIPPLDQKEVAHV
jgi:hypothetical protein